MPPLVDRLPFQAHSPLLTHCLNLKLQRFTRLIQQFGNSGHVRYSFDKASGNQLISSALDAYLTPATGTPRLLAGSLGGLG